MSEAPFARPIRPSVTLELRGSLGAKCLLVLGRTGAGKSSLINMLRGDAMLSVSDVASTTRWLEGVPCDVGRSSVTLIDSPGIGEVLTNDAYLAGIENWFALNRAVVAGLVLVLQADAKGHAGDWQMIEAFARIEPKPVIIVLNQVDKVSPVREALATGEWSTEHLLGTRKALNILEKIEETARQFNETVPALKIVPAVSEPGFHFNRTELVAVVESLLA